MVRSLEADRVLAALDAELASEAKRTGRALVWTAADREVLALIADTIDRKVDLAVLYEATPDISPRVKLSAELRLLEGSLARLLKQLKIDVPAAPVREPSHVKSARASRAAKARWGYPDASG
jgi:hypothetical protein